MKRILVVLLLSVAILAAPAFMQWQDGGAEAGPLCQYVQVNQYWVRHCSFTFTQHHCERITYWDNQLNLYVVVEVCVPTEP